MTDWQTRRIFCPNCGKLLFGVGDKGGKIKFRCPVCAIEVVQTPKGRRHNTLDVYAPR